MAIVQFSSTTTASSASTTSLVINKPTDVVAGDLFTAGVTCDGTVPTPPSGWTEFGGILHASASWNIRFYYRVATGAEGSSFTWTVGSVGPCAGYINAWRGVKTSDPIAVFVETESTTSSEPNTGPSADTTPVADGRLFYIRAVRDSPGGGSAVAANLTESAAGISRRANVGGVSTSGNTSYTIMQASGDTDFSGAGSKSGLAVTCDISEDHNYEATYALTALVDVSGDAPNAAVTATASAPGKKVGAKPPAIG